MRAPRSVLSATIQSSCHQRRPRNPLLADSSWRSGLCVQQQRPQMCRGATKSGINCEATAPLETVLQTTPKQYPKNGDRQKPACLARSKPRGVTHLLYATNLSARWSVVVLQCSALCKNLPPPDEAGQAYATKPGQHACLQAGHTTQSNEQPGIQAGNATDVLLRTSQHRSQLSTFQHRTDAPHRQKALQRLCQGKMPDNPPKQQVVNRSDPLSAVWR